MTATNLTAHAIDIEFSVTGGLESGRYRWVCSCGCLPGVWKPRALQARQGGSRHAAAMERGKGGGGAREGR